MIARVTRNWWVVRFRAGLKLAGAIPRRRAGRRIFRRRSVITCPVLWSMQLTPGMVTGCPDVSTCGFRGIKRRAQMRALRAYVSSPQTDSFPLPLYRLVPLLSPRSMQRDRRNPAAYVARKSGPQYGKRRSRRCLTISRGETRKERCLRHERGGQHAQRRNTQGGGGWNGLARPPGRKQRPEKRRERKLMSTAPRSSRTL